MRTYFAKTWACTNAGERMEFMLDFSALTIIIFLFAAFLAN